FVEAFKCWSRTSGSGGPLSHLERGPHSISPLPLFCSVLARSPSPTPLAPPPPPPSRLAVAGGTRWRSSRPIAASSSPNDSAFLWMPRRGEAERRAAIGCLTLSGPLDRLVRASFGDTPRDNVVTLDFDVGPEESTWVVEAVPAE
ncbi:unnamed protein product, partial [Urochloa humidicola]